MIAGPSEILVIADRDNDPDWIALDLLSQAEHDQSAQAIAGTINIVSQELVQPCPVHPGRLKSRDKVRMASLSGVAKGSAASSSPSRIA